MKRFILKLTALSLCCAMLLAFGATSAQAQKLVVTVANKTDAPVFLAFGGISEGGENDGDFARGWFRVESGQTKNISVCDYSPVYGYYYYAENAAKKRYWHGKGMSGGTVFWIHPTKAFRNHPDRKIAGGKRVYFRPLKENMGKARLNLTAR